MSEFQYLQLTHVDSYRFYQLPQELYLLKRYANLSNDACVLYAILKDRLRLSVANGWIDDSNNIYFLFSREQAAELIRVSKPTIIKIFKELREVNLLYEKNRGRGIPKMLYLGMILNDGEYIKTPEYINSSSKEILPEKLKNFTSRSKKSLPLEVKNFYPNNTNINNTNNIYIKNPKEENEKDDKVPYDEIIKIYNNTCKSLPMVLKKTKARCKNIKTFYLALENMEAIKTVFQKVEKSDFLSGRNGTWTNCSFDWILKESNYTKVIEGNYENKNNKSDFTQVRRKVAVVD